MLQPILILLPDRFFLRRFLPSSSSSRPEIDHDHQERWKFSEKKNILIIKQSYAIIIIIII